MQKKPKQLEKAIYFLSACHIAGKGLLVMVKLIFLQIATTDCCAFLVMHLLSVLPTLADNGQIEKKKENKIVKFLEQFLIPISSYQKFIFKENMISKIILKLPGNTAICQWFSCLALDEQ